MFPVKTYTDVNRQDQSLSFGISRMEEIHDKRNGVTDEPHRHDYYTIILTLEADGKHLIDFNTYDLKDGQIYFLSPGQVHQIIEHKRSVGYSIVFSNQFLIENNIPQSFIDDLNLFNHTGETPPLPLSRAELDRLIQYAEEMITLNASDMAFKYDAIGSVLKLILIHCNNLCGLSRPDIHTQESGNVLLRGFKELLNEKYQHWHGTSEYAEALHVSPDHLNRVVKSLTGKTTKEHIQNRIIIAAKRLLYFTGLSQKEIGFELGFSEPANFSAFFKKCTGVSPSAFREN